MLCPSTASDFGSFATAFQAHAVVPAHHRELIEQAIAQLAGLALVGGGPGYRSLTGSEFARALGRARAFETVSY
jgi:hypothetical protein